MADPLARVSLDVSTTSHEEDGERPLGCNGYTDTQICAESCCITWPLNSEAAPHTTPVHRCVAQHWADMHAIGEYSDDHQTADAAQLRGQQNIELRSAKATTELATTQIFVMASKIDSIDLCLSQSYSMVKLAWLAHRLVPYET
ncbi:hypothetical protein OPT61_g10033 [Boeremia exigua]|uniref:Uncharacterized protein n=1 Tax=Boeremia exigua TaxID=749465 RepID=A0ACC2HRH9_9PLEO|nr:hypothetical protein OPT61_g10033 [Boeremia exigua]